MSLSVEDLIDAKLIVMDELLNKWSAPGFSESGQVSDIITTADYLAKDVLVSAMLDQGQDLLMKVFGSDQMIRWAAETSYLQKQIIDFCIFECIETLSVNDFEKSLRYFDILYNSKVLRIEEKMDVSTLKGRLESKDVTSNDWTAYLINSSQARLWVKLLKNKDCDNWMKYFGCKLPKYVDSKVYDDTFLHHVVFMKSFQNMDIDLDFIKKTLKLNGLEEDKHEISEGFVSACFRHDRSDILDMLVQEKFQCVESIMAKDVPPHWDVDDGVSVFNYFGKKYPGIASIEMVELTVEQKHKALDWLFKHIDKETLKDDLEAMCHAITRGGLGTEVDDLLIGAIERQQLINSSLVDASDKPKIMAL